jgi:hypothetical protein
METWQLVVGLLFMAAVVNGITYGLVTLGYFLDKRHGPTRRPPAGRAPRKREAAAGNPAAAPLPQSPVPRSSGQRSLTAAGSRAR